MCLALTATITAISKTTAQADFGGVSREIDITFVQDEVTVGSQVLVHTGLALQVLSPEEAELNRKAMEQAFNVGTL